MMQPETQSEEEQTSHDDCLSGTGDYLQNRHKKFILESDGKRHILPINILANLQTLVQQKSVSFAREIIDDEKETSSLNQRIKFDHSISACGGPKEGASRHRKRHFIFKMQGAQSQHSKRGKCRTSSPSSAPDERQNVKRKRPNFFVAVQVTDPKIHDAAKQFQKDIQDKCQANLSSAFVWVEKLHITLMVMHLHNEDEMKRASENLDNCVSTILDRISHKPLVLDFEGVSSFSGGRVVFTCVKPSEGLDHLHFAAGEVKRQMEENGIMSTDNPNKEFNPHLTLIKMQGQKELLRQGVKKVDASLFLPYANKVFGSLTVSSLQLCEMERKQEDGYYFVHHEAPFHL